MKGNLLVRMVQSSKCKDSTKANQNHLQMMVNIVENVYFIAINGKLFNTIKSATPTYICHKIFENLIYSVTGSLTMTCFCILKIDETLNKLIVPSMNTKMKQLSDNCWVLQDWWQTRRVYTPKSNIWQHMVKSDHQFESTTEINKYLLSNKIL